MGLLHDAAEAFLCDIPTPTKRWLLGYVRYEEEILVAVAQHFRLHSVYIPESVKIADARLLATEVPAMMAPPPAPWNLQAAPYDTLSFHYWCPEDAEAHYLQRLRDLGAL